MSKLLLAYTVCTGKLSILPSAGREMITCTGNSWAKA